MDRYVVHHGERLRCGYTTGSCAAGASKMAVSLLFGGAREKNHVEITTPLGEKLFLPIAEVEKGQGWVRCGIVKDGGDDPDVTTGLTVYAQAEEIEEPKITIEGGEGVGRVTKPGLAVSPGGPAINPVPLSMIHRAVREVLPSLRGVRITLSIPGGEERARYTFNPRLGILGGLSILGTTGIVEPLSHEGWKETISLELSVLVAQGRKEVVLVPGNYGRFIAEQRGFSPEEIVAYGNFLGLSLERVVELGFKRLFLVGDIGKLVKVAGGIFYTEGRLVDARMEILAGYAALFGASSFVVEKVLSLTTTEEALKVLEESGVDLVALSRRIAERIRERCLHYVQGKVAVGVILGARERGILAEVDSGD